jgi:hypothetical protein
MVFHTRVDGQRSFTLSLSYDSRELLVPRVTVISESHGTTSSR